MAMKDYSTHKILWDVEIQTDQLFSARKPDLVIINPHQKKKRSYSRPNFIVSVDLKEKIKESEKSDKYLDLAREPKKLWNMRLTVIQNTNWDWCTWNDPQRLVKRNGRHGNWRTNRDHPNSCIKISPSAEKSPGDLWRLAVTQAPLKDHQQTLMRETRVKCNNNNNDNNHWQWWKTEAGASGETVIKLYAFFHLLMSQSICPNDSPLSNEELLAESRAEMYSAVERLTILKGWE